MGLLSWLLGPRGYTGPIVDLDEDDRFPLPVVGTSRYQSALRKIHDRLEVLSIEGDGITIGESQLEAIAILYHEDNNRYDKNAIRVEFDGEKIGYLSRDDAVVFRTALIDAGKAGYAARCKAILIGGGRKGGFGVRLGISLRPNRLPFLFPQ